MFDKKLKQLTDADLKKLIEELEPDLNGAYRDASGPQPASSTRLERLATLQNAYELAMMEYGKRARNRQTP